MKRLLSSIRDGNGFDIVLVAFPLGFLFLMAGLPLLYNILMSFQEVDMFSLGTFLRPFVGFKNYQDLFAQPETWPILGNTAIFVIGSIAGQFLIGFGLALFFWVNFPGASWLRGLFLVSWVMPGLVVGAIWNWILSGDFGVLNFMLRETGIISGNIFWRSDPNYSLYAVIMANVWLGTAFNMILLSVGLASIPWRSLRGCRTRRRQCLAAVLDDHPADDALDHRRHHFARPDLHAAAVRPFCRDHLGRTEQFVQRHAILGLGPVLPAI
jgi:multiple sugar transport system permease protein